ncbi:PucC family protein [Rhodomicrobium sp.]|uniref:PucC family protein n=1 Tax=Rhodomicrobium sp. TaxID=2720632 RepID=UPI0039E6EF08
MTRISQRVTTFIFTRGSQFLPFADAATPELPLSRLLRLSLFQVSVGMALVLLVGTLNRVMIVELNVPASVVAIMVSMPLFFAPFRALIGHRSDTHKSVLGWRRVPFIWQGSLVQFGGLAIMPFAILILSGQGDVAVPAWIGHLAAGIAFLLVGAGLHTVQTVGLALATDLAPKESQPKVVGLMYVMLLFGMILSAILFGLLLTDFTPGRLIQVIQGAAVATLVLNTIALWKQEARRPSRLLTEEERNQKDPTFQESWAVFVQGGNAIRRLGAVALGTAAFSMHDVLLEPYGGQILHLSVSATTKLTATLAVGGLLGFALASRVLSRGFDPFRMAFYGALVGIPAFLAVIMAAPTSQPWLFVVGTSLIGFGAGLFGHGTLTATMNLAPKDQTGLALGAWGAAQATAAGFAVASGGIIRDVIASFGEQSFGPATGYIVVYSIEVVLLVAALIAMIPLLRTSTVAPVRDEPPASDARQTAMPLDA